VDKEFVNSLNQVFYDVEAKLYDDRHPEVLEGNQVWWNQLGETLAQSFKNNEEIKFLDVGCGTGYVGDIIAPYLRTESVSKWTA
jgi:ubiquinone/menaquinone biosynthesis C-methylase UbiE